MNTAVALDTQRVSITDLMAAGLLNEDFRCPHEMTKLSRKERMALERDPLTPVTRKDTAGHEVQHRLLQCMLDQSSDVYLKAYCNELLKSPRSVLDFLANQVRSESGRVPQTVRPTHLSENEGRTVVALCSLWEVLQGHARLLPSAAPEVVFKSVRTKQAVEPTDDSEGQLSQ